jgi:fructokinase
MMIDGERLVGGIELGGTKSIALLARGRNIVAMARMPTGDPDATLAALSSTLAAWESDYGQPSAIGIGSFGPAVVDPGRPEYGTITNTPKKGWSSVDVVGHFAERFDGPIAFDTDVAGAALAELHWGAAQGCGVVVYITIGTGIGAGILVGGNPVHGFFHPEVGHTRIRRLAGDDFPGICPYHGDCLEGLASGPAIAARTGQPAAELADDHAIWGLVADELSETLAMLMLTMAPDRILIGGGVMQSRRQLLDPIRSRTAHLLAGYLPGTGAAGLATIIQSPALGVLAGPLGAVALAYRA